jgi:PAS domain S-box-containing protein
VSADGPGPPAALEPFSPFALIEASQALAHARDPQALPGLLFELARCHARAERGWLLWREHGLWVTRAGFAPGAQWSEMSEDATLPRIEAGAPIPAGAIELVCSAMRPLQWRDDAAGAIDRGTLLGVPIVERGEGLGLLFLAGGELEQSLEAARLEAWHLVGNQFAIALRVARRMAELERGVDAMQAILDSSPAMVSMKDRDGRILLHNRQWARVFQGTERSYVGRLLNEFNRDAELTAISLANDVAIFRDNQVRQFETRIVIAGETRTHRAEKFPVRDAEGKTFAVGMVSLDVTELKLAQAAAEAAAGAKSDFLANMSHEIRTPMNAILGMAHLALAAGMPPKQQNYVVKIELSARSLLGVINDILDFSKVEAGKLDLECVPLRLAEVLDNLAAVVGLAAHAKGIELVFDLAPDLPEVLLGDAMRLTQVLVNLAGNGIKFTERGAVVVEVGVGAREAGHVTLTFAVADTGVGMEASTVGRLFRPFEQADNSISRRYGGTGLGLAISHSLVKLMGGSLEVRSEVGRGSRFEFALRLTLQAQASAPVAFPRLPAMRVLVVDDNEAARRAIAAALSALELRCECADDGWSALRAVALAAQDADPFDLVLLDSRMPGMDGVECARAIAGAGHPHGVIALMASIFDRDDVMRESELRDLQQVLPALSVLLKPVTPSSLLELILGQPGRVDLAMAPTPHDRRELLRGRRLLLVEDNAINQELALELLGDAGIEVVVADDGQQALAVLQSQHCDEFFDAVLMDVQMPVMDGYEATRLLRLDARWQALPVIAMTANAMAGDRERALAAGMNDHIAKPIEVKQMFDTIARWVRADARGDLG